MKQKRSARERLSEALAGFEALGASVWAERARAELARIGGRSPAERLTETEERIARLVADRRQREDRRRESAETEERIARLVAEGHSNKEVAAALFVTPKTVEATLTRIYAKLGIRSRAALARRFVAEGTASVPGER